LSWAIIMASSCVSNSAIAAMSSTKGKGSILVGFLAVEPFCRKLTRWVTCVKVTYTNFGCPSGSLRPRAKNAPVDCTISFVGAVLLVAVAVAYVVILMSFSRFSFIEPSTMRSTRHHPILKNRSLMTVLITCLSSAKLISLTLYVIANVTCPR
jgi:hypothetical protein